MSKVVGNDGHDRPLYELEAEADECSQAVADAQVRREEGMGLVSGRGEGREVIVFCVLYAWGGGAINECISKTDVNSLPFLSLPPPPLPSAQDAVRTACEAVMSQRRMQGRGGMRGGGISDINSNGHEDRLLAAVQQLQGAMLALVSSTESVHLARDLELVAPSSLASLSHIIPDPNAGAVVSAMVAISSKPPDMKALGDLATRFGGFDEAKVDQLFSLLDKICIPLKQAAKTPQEKEADKRKKKAATVTSRLVNASGALADSNMSGTLQCE